MNIEIVHVDSNFEREPLNKPFGFKGGSMNEIWQTAILVTSQTGHIKIGLNTQNVLWSDARVFAGFSEAAANAMMYSVTDFALQHVCGLNFRTPIELLDMILDDISEYAQKVTGDIDLKRSFVLNSLVGLDLAAWLLYAAENDLTTFDQLVPDDFKAALRCKHHRVAAIPLISYGVSAKEIGNLIKKGHFFMKIKLGQSGTQEEMLSKDKARLLEIHKALGSLETPHTLNGKIPYYFDANGRYESKELLLQFLDYADKVGALPHIALLEEPFPEELEESVADIPVRVAADESVHTDADALRRIEMGYSAFALKPIAKTLSMTLKIAKTAYIHNIACFCADLTVNPVLADWNKNVAARLTTFPGMKQMGLMESNGAQNYREWERMKSFHPAHGAQWIDIVDGCFVLDDEFYQRSGGIFETSSHYDALFNAERE
ncbi:MAG: L-alanine-DL-glutamate epimerase [Calditrichaeota bacterium]|nr:MAG: L-alanine-DL-glutamate epimerase [Calditrichota bacterium]